MAISDHLFHWKLDELDQNTPRLPTIEDEDVRQSSRLFSPKHHDCSFRSSLSRWPVCISTVLICMSNHLQRSTTRKKNVSISKVRHGSIQLDSEKHCVKHEPPASSSIFLIKSKKSLCTLKQKKESKIVIKQTELWVVLYV